MSIFSTNEFGLKNCYFSGFWGTNEILSEMLFKFPSCSNVNTIWLGCNSRKDYEVYSLENLEYIYEAINDLPNYLKSKIFLKNSFKDKYESKKLKRYKSNGIVKCNMLE